MDVFLRIRIFSGSDPYFWPIRTQEKSPEKNPRYETHVKIMSFCQGGSLFIRYGTGTRSVLEWLRFLCRLQIRYESNLNFSTNFEQHVTLITKTILTPCSVSLRGVEFFELKIRISPRKLIFKENHFYLLIRSPDGFDSWNKKMPKNIVTLATLNRIEHFGKSRTIPVLAR